MAARSASSILVGTAGWAIPRAVRDAFPDTGSLLERYAARFPATEINSSFHRPHQVATYERWARSTPPEFRFAVKVPKVITHERGLSGVEQDLDRFLAECGALGDKLGPLLVQLPPKSAFGAQVAPEFFAALRERFAGDVVCEPRHASWFTPEAGELLSSYRVARVAADPARVPEAAEPGGWEGIAYYRLHGSPRVYWSAYSEESREALAGLLLSHCARGIPVWCIFDNTASGAAAGDALDAMRRTESTR